MSCWRGTPAVICTDVDIKLLRNEIDQETSRNEVVWENRLKY